MVLLELVLGFWKSHFSFLALFRVWVFGFFFLFTSHFTVNDHGGILKIGWSAWRQRVGKQFFCFVVFFPPKNEKMDMQITELDVWGQTLVAYFESMNIYKKKQWLLAASKNELGLSLDNERLKAQRLCPHPARPHFLKFQSIQKSIMNTIEVFPLDFHIYFQSFHF